MSFVTFPFSFRHWQSAKHECATQVLLCQTMHGNKIAHLLHRFAKGELLFYIVSSTVSIDV
mgnify:FL=1